MLKFENPLNGRFYYLSIEKDLLDEKILKLTYGGKLVTRQRTICSASDDIDKKITEITKRRLSRGYVYRSSA